MQLQIPVLLAGLVSVVTPALAAERPLSFTDGGWELKGERAAVAKEDGRDVLRLETGFAYRRDVKLDDGTIDFEVKLTRRRSFVYLAFRMERDDAHEEIYLRPHKSDLPDALQYAPVWQGRSGWQLYHGPGGTAAVAFEPGAWTRVRVVVQGRRGALFIGDLTKPVMLMTLAREPRAGYIALRGFAPESGADKGPVATYANVVIRPGEVPFDFASTPPPARKAVPGAVRAWDVSAAFAPKDDDATGATALPPAGATGAFQRFDTEADGLLELHRLVRIPAGMRDTAALARVAIRAARAGTYAFDLGFSDIATVFVNGRPVFRGDASYSFDNPRREGLIESTQARLYLPLTAGENDLAILVRDGFGGWAVMGRFQSADGLTVEARAAATSSR